MIAPPVTIITPDKPINNLKLIMSFDTTKERIKNKGIKSSDIKHKDLLTFEQIQSIKPEQAFTWIKSNNWKQKDFIKWLNLYRKKQNDTSPT